MRQEAFLNGIHVWAIVGNMDEKQDIIICGTVDGRALVAPYAKDGKNKDRIVIKRFILWTTRYIHTIAEGGKMQEIIKKELYG